MESARRRTLTLVRTEHLLIPRTPHMRAVCRLECGFCHAYSKASARARALCLERKPRTKSTSSHGRPAVGALPATRKYRSGNRNCALYSGICAVPTLALHSETWIWEFVGPSCCVLRVPKRGPRKIGNSESGIWDTICLGPNRWTEEQEGASETRKLGIWNLGVPWARTQVGCSSETRKLGIWNLGDVPPDRTQEGASETRKLCREYPGICTLGILESGICGGVSRNLYTWNVGII